MTRRSRFTLSALAALGGVAVACATRGPAPKERDPVAAPTPAADAGEEADPLVVELTQPKQPEPPPPGPNVPHPSNALAGDPLAQQRADFRAAVQEARAELKAGKPRDVASSITRIDKLSEPLGPPEQREAAEIAFDISSQANDGRRMRSASERWLLACGPDRVAACRERALRAMEVAARAQNRDGSLGERVKAIRRADRCLVPLESHGWKREGKPPPCLSESVDLFRRTGDRLMLARALFAKAGFDASAERKVPAAISELTFADTECGEPRCIGVKHRVYEKLIDLETRTGDFQEAAMAAIRDMETANASSRAPSVLYARTRWVEQTCARLDDKTGPGTCRAWEKKLTNHYTFHDFSNEKSGESLSQDNVKRVGREYGVLIEECLRTQAERMAPPAEVTFSVRWVVNNAGLIEQLHMENKELEETPLAHCLRSQASIWRYPRTNGQLQHVEQSFTVRATQR